MLFNQSEDMLERKKKKWKKTRMRLLLLLLLEKRVVLVCRTQKTAAATVAAAVLWNETIKEDYFLRNSFLWRRTVYALFSNTHEKRSSSPVQPCRTKPQTANERKQQIFGRCHCAGGSTSNNRAAARERERARAHKRHGSHS